MNFSYLQSALQRRHAALHPDRTLFTKTRMLSEGHGSRSRPSAARVVSIRWRHAGCSEEALAAAARLDRTYISLLERGRYSVWINTLESIAGMLDVEPHTLIMPVSNDQRC